MDYSAFDQPETREPHDGWNDCQREHCAMCNKYRRWIADRPDAAQERLDQETRNTARTDLVTS